MHFLTSASTLRQLRPFTNSFLSSALLAATLPSTPSPSALKRKCPETFHSVLPKIIPKAHSKASTAPTTSHQKQTTAFEIKNKMPDPNNDVRNQVAEPAPKTSEIRKQPCTAEIKPEDCMNEQEAHDWLEEMNEQGMKDYEKWVEEQKAHKKWEEEQQA
ncbi:hypothetical protein ACHAPU_008442 [Fusarium lateritium]